MAIGIRRDRGGVMPGTMALPAEVETGLVKGDIAKLDAAGELVQGVAGDVYDNNARFLVVSDFVSGVTNPAATGTTLYDCIVVPLDDQLTFVGAVSEAGAGDLDALVVGSKIDLNATGDGFVIDDDPAPTDFIITKILVDSSTSGSMIVEAVKA